MTTTRSNTKEKKDGLSNYPLPAETKHGLQVLFLFVVALIFVLSVLNLAGAIGQGVSYALFFMFGRLAWSIPVLLLLVSYYLLTSDKIWHFWKSFGLVLMVFSLGSLGHATLPINEWRQAAGDLRGGGYIGYGILWLMFKVLGFWGSVVLLFGFLISGALIFFQTSPTQIIARLRSYYGAIKARFAAHAKTVINQPGSFKPASRIVEMTLPSLNSLFKSRNVTPDNLVDKAAKTTTVTEPKLPLPARRIDLSENLLDDRIGNPTAGNIKANQEKIYKTLANFGIEVEMGPVNVGPTVTQYTLAPAQGIKLSHITALANDLALALAAHPIRIEAPIPGQSLVGIEVPNQSVAVVGLKEIITSKEFKNRPSQLTVALGKDVAGQPWVIDIERMPHLLIAGATGSGKSVCINDILLSLLFTNSPDELKLIIIDPKRVELSSYNDIPHLWTPVITDIDKTINALKWVVGEMDRRYQVLSQVGKRNIASYNQTAVAKLPYIIVVIDELADLMAVAAQEVEAAIIRLAQMARAVGIHLIVATQRPSVDVITGLIKANITSRIAFAVASGIDSRTILDTSGAEKLLGRGDCLYISAELSKPKRLQAAFVSDEEIERVTNFVKDQSSCDYNMDIAVKPRGGINSLGEPMDGSDDLLAAAQSLVTSTGKASATYLQRRLRVGYARAARLLDLLEQRGVVGPGQGSKPREVLVKNDSISAFDSDEEIEPAKNGENDYNDN